MEREERKIERGEKKRKKRIIHLPPSHRPIICIIGIIIWLREDTLT